MKSAMWRQVLRRGRGSAIRGSVMAGVAVARKLRSPTLLDPVRAAFVHGMDDLLWVGAGIGLAGLALALIFLPKRIGTAGNPAAATPQPATAARDQPRWFARNLPAIHVPLIGLAGYLHARNLRAAASRR